MSSLARSSDPHTSHLAARKVKETLNARQQDVLMVARQMPDFTDEELEERFAASVARKTVEHQEPSSLRTRRSELEKKGLVGRTMFRRPSRKTGNAMTVWSAS